MIKTIKVNYSQLLFLLISFTLLCFITACGGSKDAGAGGTGTTDTGLQISSFAGLPTSLAAGQSSILTVKVTNSSGTAVSGATVNFDFVGSSASGGTVTALNGGTTDAGGKAVAVYTAGAALSPLVRQDTIQATCGSAAEALIITITASASGSAGYQITLSADTTSLTEGQSSIITATVTSGGVAAADVPVAFSFIGTPASGGILTPLGTNTDGGGKIIAVYKAGALSPTADVQDTIEADVDSEATFGVVIISRAGTASGGTVIAGYKMIMSADVKSLAAGQSSIITAVVTDSSGNAQQGLTVGFSFVGSSASGGTVTALNGGLTDASGTAVAVYTAGATSAPSIVQDTVQANVSSGGYSSTGAVVITRTAASASTAGYQMNLTASTTSMKAGGSSIITAAVTNGAGNPVENQAVTFSFAVPTTIGSTFVTLGGVTDASGKAVAVYTAGTGSGTEDVQDTFQASVTNAPTVPTYSAYGAVVLTRTGTASTTTVPAGYILTLTAPLSSVPATGHSVLTAKVTDGASNPVSGLLVTFAIPTNSSGATWAPHTATTDAAGRAVTTYTAGSTDPTHTVYDAVTASVSGAADAVVITRTASGYVPTGNVITVTPTPLSLVAGALSAVVASVTTASGNPVVGATVTFALEVDNSGAGLSPLTATTDGSGKAFSIYTAGTNSPALKIDDAVSASVAGASSAALITRLPAAGTGKRILSFIQTPLTSSTLPIAPPWNQVQMKVKVTTDDGITPVTNEEVSFSIIIGEGTILDAATNTAAEGDPALTVLTDNNGEAYVYFERPSIADLGDTVVRAQIEGTTYGGDAASIVYWRGWTTTLTLAVDPASVKAGGTSTVTATVTDGNGNALFDLPVTFNLEVNSSGATVTPVGTGRTDGSGKATAVYTAGATAPTTDNVSASATYLLLESTDAKNITVAP